MTRSSTERTGGEAMFSDETAKVSILNLAGKCVAQFPIFEVALPAERRSSAVCSTSNPSTFNPLKKEKRLSVSSVSSTAASSDQDGDQLAEVERKWNNDPSTLMSRDHDHSCPTSASRRTVDNVMTRIVQRLGLADSGEHNADSHDDHEQNQEMNTAADNSDQLHGNLHQKRVDVVPTELHPFSGVAVARVGGKDETSTTSLQPASSSTTSKVVPSMGDCKNAPACSPSATTALPYEVWLPAVTSRFKTWLGTAFEQHNRDVLRILREELCSDEEKVKGYPRRYVFQGKAKAVRIGTYAMKPGLRGEGPEVGHAERGRGELLDQHTRLGSPKMIDLWDKPDDLVEDIPECELKIYLEKANRAVWFEFLFSIDSWPMRKERPLAYANHDIRIVRCLSQDEREEQLNACDLEIELSVALGYGGEVCRPRKFRVTLTSKEDRDALMNLLETLRAFPFGEHDQYPDFGKNCIWTRRDEFCRILHAAEIRKLYLTQNKKHDKEQDQGALSQTPMSSPSIFSSPTDYFKKMNNLNTELLAFSSDLHDPDVVEKLFDTYEPLLAHVSRLQVISGGATNSTSVDHLIKIAEDDDNKNNAEDSGLEADGEAAAFDEHGGEDFEVQDEEEQSNGCDSDTPSCTADAESGLDFFVIVPQLSY
ncbi:unnamed protein product [Amoebophrya sp. A120]|nr:unnamed protein product [Amoebophrya sp. A120]|eukprot:GSA120T00015075001.1